MISISFSLNIVLIFGNGFYRQSKSVVLRGAYFSIFLTNKQDKGKAYYVNVKLQICWEAFVKYLVAHFSVDTVFSLGLSSLIVGSDPRGLIYIL